MYLALTRRLLLCIFALVLGFSATSEAASKTQPTRLSANELAELFSQPLSFRVNPEIPPSYFYQDRTYQNCGFRFSYVRSKYVLDGAMFCTIDVEGNRFCSELYRDAQGHFYSLRSPNLSRSAPGRVWVGPGPAKPGC